MKKIPLSQGKFALVDGADYEFLMKWKWSLNSGYAARAGKFIKKDGSVKIKIILMHRFIMNTDKGMICDHISGNSLDNRRVNLRNCTSRENVKNRTKSGGGYKGLLPGFGKWRAQITSDKVRYDLGIFDTKEEAAAAYNEAAMRYHGEFASLNKIKTT